jgi:hypothetical protein
MVDVTIHDQGSVIGFHPCTEAAKKWLIENVESEGWQWLGNTLYADRRSAGPLLEGIVEAGFEVS